MILFVAHFVFGLALNAYFLLPLYLTHLGATKGQVGLISGANGPVTLLALLWLYFRADRSDTRRLMFACCLLFAVSAGIMMTTESLYVITAVRVLHGVAFPLFFVGANTLMTEQRPASEHAKYIGYLGIVTLVTQSIAPPIAEGIAAVIGYKKLFGLTGLIGLVAAGAVSAFPAARRRTDAAVHDGGSASRPVDLAATLRLTAIGLAGGSAYGVAIVFSPIYLHDRGIEPVSLFFIGYAVAAIAVRLYGRDWAERFGHVRIARYGFGAVAAAMLLLGYSLEALPFVAAAALFGTGHGLMYPALAAHTVSALPGSNARAITVWTGSFGMGITLGAAAGGQLAEFASISTAFQVAAALPVLSMLLLPRRDKCGTGGAAARG